MPSRKRFKNLNTKKPWFYSKVETPLAGVDRSHEAEAKIQVRSSRAKNKAAKASRKKNRG